MYLDACEHGCALEGAHRGLRVGRGDAKLALEVRKADAVEAAADAALKAVARTSGVAGGFVVADWGVACRAEASKSRKATRGEAGKTEGKLPEASKDARR